MPGVSSAGPIRNAARAIIIHEGRLVTVKMRDRAGPFYILPGGGQNPGETLPVTLKRECLEEIGVEVTVRELLYVREYIGKNHDFRHRHANFHQLESVFRCTIADPAKVCLGCGQDHRQIDVAWIELGHLPNIRFFPKAIIPFFRDGDIHVPRNYLGDVN